MAFFLFCRDEITDREVGWPNTFDTAQELLEWTEAIDLENDEFIIISDEPRLFRPVRKGKKWELVACDSEMAGGDLTVITMLKSVADMLYASSAVSPNPTDTVDAQQLYLDLNSKHGRDRRKSMRR